FLYIYIFLYSFFFFNAPSPSEIYTLSLHDALPICRQQRPLLRDDTAPASRLVANESFCNNPYAGDESDSALRAGLKSKDIQTTKDRKSTRLNSSHVSISYAVFCLKKKKKKKQK